MPHRRSQKGGNLLTDALAGAKTVAREAARLARENQILSDALKAGGFNRLGGMAEAAGYGKRKPLKRQQKGGSWFGDVAGGILSVPASIVAGGLGGLVGAVKGLGRHQKGGYGMPAEGLVRLREARLGIVDPGMYGMGPPRAPKIFA